MAGPLTEGNARGGDGTVKTQGPSSKPQAPPPMNTNTETEQLKKDIAFLQEQLWFSQEAVRKLMIELTNHLGAAGAEAIMGLMAEWSQIIHNINNEYTQNNKD